MVTSFPQAQKVFEELISQFTSAPILKLFTVDNNVSEIGVEGGRLSYILCVYFISLSFGSREKKLTLAAENFWLTI